MMTVACRQIQKIIGNHTFTIRNFSLTSGALSSVKLTSERYPNLKRGQFNTLNDNDITAFKNILDEGILQN